MPLMAGFPCGVYRARGRNNRSSPQGPKVSDDKLRRILGHDGHAVPRSNPQRLQAGRDLDHARVEQYANNLARAAPRLSDVSVLGPAPAPLALLRGRHRYRLLLRAQRNANVQAVVRDWIRRVAVPNGVRLQVDVDPYSFL